MTVSLAPSPVFQGVGFGGLPLPGGKLFSYQAGTNTPQATFTDSTGIAQNTNPVILNANGQANVWLVIGLTYKLILQDLFGNQIWSVDNIPGGISLNLTQQSLGQILYPLTPAEIAVGATPVNFIYPADPYVDPRRYGADPLGVINSTGAVQTALNVAYQANGMMWVANACSFLCGALSLTVTGGNSRAVRIVGSSDNGSQIKAIAGLSSPLLTITSGNPSILLIDAPVKIENLNFAQPNGIVSGGHGISIQGQSDWLLAGVTVQGFDHALDLVSSLIGIVNNNSQFIQSNIGVSISLVGTVNTTNLIRLENSRMVSNKTWGIEYNGGTQLHIKSCDIEANGTSLNFATGGLHIKGQLSPDLGAAGILSSYNWYEGNLGTSILIDAQSTSTLNFALVGGHIIGAQSGASFTCNGCTKLLIQDLVFCDTANITAIEALIENSVISTLTDIGITIPTYINIQTGSSNIYAGRITTATLSLTGCTTVPTTTATFFQQGNQITCYISDFQATSNTNTCTITGFPPTLSPTSQTFFTAVIDDNGVDGAQTTSMAAGATTMTLYKGGLSTGFTTSGVKGIRSQEFRWFI